MTKNSRHVSYCTWKSHHDPSKISEEVEKENEPNIETINHQYRTNHKISTKLKHKKASTQEAKNDTTTTTTGGAN